MAELPSLASQVRAMLPRGIRLEVLGDQVLRLVASPPGSATFDFGLLATQSGGPTPDDVRTATLALLTFVQDFAVLHTREPWPARDGPLALPVAVVRDRWVVGWYGNEPATPPIRLPLE